MNNTIEIFQTENGQSQLSVRFDHETVWLTQSQMVQLFERDQSVISRHINNMFKEGELVRESNMQKMHIANSDKPLDLYSLDVIISVGYRVKSKQGTHFRQWATRTLRDHLVHGYTLNEERLKNQQENIRQLERTLTLFQQTLIDQATLPEARGLARIITDYAQTFVLLNQFDSERLPDEGFQTNLYFEIKLDKASQAIAALKKDMLEKGEAS